MSRICMRHLTWDCKLCNPTPTTSPQGNTGTAAATPAPPPVSAPTGSTPGYTGAAITTAPTAVPPSSLGAPPTPTATVGAPANSGVVAPPLFVGLPPPVVPFTSVIPANAMPPTGVTIASLGPIITQPRKSRRTVCPREPHRKRIKRTIIDDEVACQLFKELDVDDDLINSGKVLAWGLQPDDEAFYSIHEYIANSQAHFGFGIKILTILQVMVKTDNIGDGPLDFNEDPKAQGKQRLMLWHGTKRANVCSILQNGLRLPVLSAPQGFGAGIYFADRVCKSTRFTDPYDVYNNLYTTGGHAFLFLCDVLVGNKYDSLKYMQGIQAPPAPGPSGSGPYDSVKGCGLNVPDPAADKVIDGCVWPMGKTVRSQKYGEGFFSNLLAIRFNEYIVYNTDQVRPKYLVKVEYTAQPHYENLK